MQCYKCGAETDSILAVCDDCLTNTKNSIKGKKKIKGYDYGDTSKIKTPLSKLLSSITTDELLTDRDKLYDYVYSEDFNFEKAKKLQDKFKMFGYRVGIVCFNPIYKNEGGSCKECNPSIKGFCKEDNAKRFLRHL